MKPTSPLLLIVLLLPACAHWTCTAQPALGQDAKQSLRINGFELRCTKRF